MNKIIGVTALQRNFRAVFDEVAEKKTPYILTRGSRPEAALISYDDFLYLERLREKRILARFDQLMSRMAWANERFSDREVQTDLETSTLNS
jgi:prevent-host-death family protein